MKIKTSILILGAAIMLAGTSITYVGCTTASQVQAVQTLETVGLAVDAAMATSASLYHNGQITQAQWQQIADFHDQKFIPAYKLAIQVAQSNLSSVASPDIVTLSTQLAALVASFQIK
jgi:hypothetical protein